ncbi:hypothetical protein C4561_02410 [candidate division WWE3 bacterium]|jgi:phenylalanyl-tRNA synthetase beta subunit|uniref:phenylalanine--tRNA ligase n=1 Tax=candidate division WWE3 bacterium TaxID=2053526 RepID=A0A3A4ZDV9_UNCKA|nr:MAG: hypothetical protein C4561_02410 [candidate division WWE3 bacterium]
MKIPVEWLKEYVNIKKSSAEIGKAFTSIGLMLDKPIYEYKGQGYSTEVLDLEHRMDRSDWLSVLGCARDLAAFENVPLKYPDTYIGELRESDESQKVPIIVECPDLVNRFNTVIFKNIRVGESPEWLKYRLEAYGIASINNIVDITNYVMVETGQPMHAQDLAKFQKREILIRRARKDEKITTLLGEVIELNDEYFVLTQDGKPIVLGGIVGGISTAVDNKTTEIVLDAGNYNQINIRKSSRRCKIQNETVLRYDKYLNPKLTELALMRAIKLILENAGGEVYKNMDWYPSPTADKNMVLRYDRVSRLSGMQIEPEKVKRILKSLEYKILEENNTEIKLQVPHFRTDVAVEDDLVADVLRINDYANIPVSFIKNSPPKEITPEIYNFEEELREICVRAGMHEHISDPLVQPNPEDKTQVILENAISAEKSGLRTEGYSGLENVSDTYVKHKIKDIKLFEIGKIYSKIGTQTKLENFTETRILEVYNKNIDLSLKENSGNTVRLLSTVMRDLGIVNYRIDYLDGKSVILVDEDTLGEIRHTDFNLLTEMLLKHRGQPHRIISEYRVVKTEDISVIVPKAYKSGPLVHRLKSVDNNIIDIHCLIEELESLIGPESKNLLLKFSYLGGSFSQTKEKIIEILGTEGLTVRR